MYIIIAFVVFVLGPVVSQGKKETIDKLTSQRTILRDVLSNEHIVNLRLQELVQFFHEQVCFSQFLCGYEQFYVIKCLSLLLRRCTHV